MRGACLKRSFVSPKKPDLPRAAATGLFNGHKFYHVFCIMYFLFFILYVVSTHVFLYCILYHSYSISLDEL